MARPVKTEEQVVRGPYKLDLAWVGQFVLTMGLALLSWYATYFGIQQMITGGSPDLFDGSNVPIMLLTAILMLMIVWLLDKVFKPLSLWLRLVLVLAYLFLTLISIGFGFGFYWKMLNARTVADQDARVSIRTVRNELGIALGRLSDLVVDLRAVANEALQRAQIERERGGTCGPSAPGQGPRMRLREADAAQLTRSVETLQRKLAPLKSDIEGLKALLSEIASSEQSRPNSIVVDTERDRRFQDADNKVQSIVSRYNGLRADPVLLGIAKQFDERARKVRFRDTKSGSNIEFDCPDPALKYALETASSSISGLPQISAPPIKSLEGAEGVKAAISRFETTLRSLFAKTFTVAAGGEAVRTPASSGINSSSTDPPKPMLGSDDILPLVLAIFVDFCLLILALAKNRDPLDRVPPEADEEAVNVANILRSFVPGITPKAFTQRVYHYKGTDYFAVPDLNINGGWDATNGGLITAMGALSFMEEIPAQKVPSRMNLRRQMEQRGFNVPPGSHVRVYRFPARLKARLLNALRDRPLVAPQSGNPSDQPQPGAPHNQERSPSRQIQRPGGSQAPNATDPNASPGVGKGPSSGNDIRRDRGGRDVPPE